MALITNKSIFYHIPKTGGVWVEKIIGLHCPGARFVDMGRNRNSKFGLFLKHTVPAEVAYEDKKGLFSYCFVRYPVEWYKSFWNHRMNKDEKVDSIFPLSKCWSVDFEEFIDNCLRMFPKGFVSELYQCYTGENLKGVDFIGKQENLREDLKKALTLAGETFDENMIDNYRPRNVSAKRQETLNLSKELEEKIIKTENWAINNFYK